MLRPEESGLPLTEPFRSGDLVVLFRRRGYLVDDPGLGVLTFSLRTTMLGARRSCERRCRPLPQ